MSNKVKHVYSPYRKEENTRPICFYSHVKDNYVKAYEQIPVVHEPKTFGNLKVFCFKAASHYLLIDNPPENENKFFTRHGKKGRLRAQNYLMNVIEKYHGEELLQHLIRDLYRNTQTNLLGCGTFKARLKEALCKYFGITNEKIDEEVKDRLIESANYTNIFAGTIPSTEFLRDSVIDDFIKGKTAYLPPLREQNITFKAIGNADL